MIESLENEISKEKTHLHTLETDLETQRNVHTVSVTLLHDYIILTFLGCSFSSGTITK